MYTELKTYQIIIALMKKWGIRHCVLSAGSRNVPFVHSVEEDPYFKCYSVVDERSAGYFALGLAQELNEPVLISCTASTASCNYWPPVAEAWYQGVPLIILTSDRDVAMLGQWEDQMIDQVGMFDRHVRKSVNLPEVQTQRDFIYCQRLVNEAFLELKHNGTGPVHINVPMKSYNNSFNVKELPHVTKIDRLGVFDEDKLWNNKIEKLKNCKRILITCGQSNKFSSELLKQLTLFFRKYNSAISVEHMSNVQCEGSIHTSVCMDTRYITDSKFETLIPDIVISYGYNITQGLKEMLRKYSGKFEHWLIQEDGRVIDMYKGLTTIFECPPSYFFKRCNEYYNNIQNNMVYYNILKEYAESVKYPEFEYCNIYGIQQIVENVPSGSILHLAINNSIRIANFFKTKANVKTYANIGTYGIDGCLSSLIGQSNATDSLCFHITGDLAFFYDMNALRIKHISKNVRVFMVNNEGGEEFYYNQCWKNEASDLHTTARHHTKAEGWVNECGFTYIGVHNKEEMSDALKIFMNKEHDKPVFIEFFSEMKDDSDKIYKFYDLSRPKDFKSELIRQTKEIVKKTIGQEKAQKIASKFGLKS